MQLSRGTKLARYRIESLLGRGGMGEVYKARDEALDRDVALKILRPDLTTDQEPVLRFKREAKILSSLNHPHIVHVYDVGESEFGQFIAMEFVDGRTLRELSTGAPAGSQTLRTSSRSQTRWRKRTTLTSCIATSSRRTSSCRATDMRRSRISVWAS